VYKSKRFIRIPIFLTLSFFALETLMKYLVSYGMKALVVNAIVLFLIGIFFYLIAKKTGYRNKEILFATFSSVLVYFSVLETPFIIGIVYMSSLLSFFIIFFLALLLIQGGEFNRLFFNLLLLLLFLARFITQLSSNYFYLAALIVSGILLAIFFYLKGTSSGYFEKSSFYSAGFSFSVIVFIRVIIIMVAGK